MNEQGEERIAAAWQGGRYWLWSQAQKQGRTTVSLETATEFGLQPWQCDCIVQPTGDPPQPAHRRERASTRLVCNVCGEIQPGLTPDADSTQV